MTIHRAPPPLRLVAVLAGVFSAVGVSAQGERGPERDTLPSVAASLAAFEVVSLRGWDGPAHLDAWPAVEAVLRPSAYSPARVDSVLTGFERLALESDAREVRAQSVFNLARAGREPIDGGPPITGVIGRLRAVYLATRHQDVRRHVATLTYDMVEAEEAAAFLEEIVLEDPPRDPASSDWPASFLALNNLTRSPEGRAVLRRLHDSGSVPRRFQSYVDRLALNGFHMIRR